MCVARSNNNTEEATEAGNAMKGHLQRYDAVLTTLRRLEQYGTVSPFSRQFYRFIYNCLGLPGLDAEKLRQAFHLFLRLECRRHHTIGHIVHQGRLDLVEILRFGSRVHELLNRICRAVERIELAGPREAMLRELILVECNYHLGRTEQVIHALRRTIHLGCRHPLVHFALGYNLYRSAIKRFTHPAPQEGKVIAHDPPAFESICCDAIAAFQAGFGDQRYDAQLWWWIGLVSEAIGERADARHAYREAMDANPANFMKPAQEKLCKLGGASDARPLEEHERLARLGPITEEEIEEARRFLAEPDALSFFLDGNDS